VEAALGRKEIKRTGEEGRSIGKSPPRDRSSQSFKVKSLSLSVERGPSTAGRDDFFFKIERAVAGGNFISFSRSSVNAPPSSTALKIFTLSTPPATRREA
jgi:hypothetical protein